MHFAPAVRFPVGRSAKPAVLTVLVWTLGAAAVAAWALQTGAAAPAVTAASLVCAVCGGVAWRFRPGRTHGVLRWDQGEWTWQAQADAATTLPSAASPVLAVTELATLVDVPDTLLLRLRTSSGVRWLWLDRAHDPAAWADLRRALRAHPRTTPGPAGRPVADTP